MKQLSQSEFESQIERLLKGDITRRNLAKELETDIRTLNTKIVELAETNPELYKRFVEKFPYQPKEIKVDIEKLAIRVIRRGVEAVVSDTGISRRTISRKVKTLEKDNPELYELYVIRNKKMTFDERTMFNEKVAKLEKNLLQKLERRELEEKEKEIRDTLAKFEELVAGGMEKAPAARALGFDGYPTIWKKYQELRRIESERNARQERDENTLKQETDTRKKEKSDFRNGLRVDVSQMETHVQKVGTEERIIKRDEGKGKED